MARAPELAGPDSSSRSGPRLTSAKAGAALICDGEAEVAGVEVDGGRHVVDEVADAGEFVGAVIVMVGSLGGLAASRNPIRGLDFLGDAPECRIGRRVGVGGGGRVGQAPMRGDGRSVVTRGDLADLVAQRDHVVEAAARRQRPATCGCRGSRSMPYSCAGPAPRSGATRVWDDCPRWPRRPGHHCGAAAAPRPSGSARCCRCTGTTPSGRGPASRCPAAQRRMEGGGGVAEGGRRSEPGRGGSRCRGRRSCCAARDQARRAQQPQVVGDQVLRLLDGGDQLPYSAITEASSVSSAQRSG